MLATARSVVLSAPFRASLSPLTLRSLRLCRSAPAGAPPCFRCAQADWASSPPVQVLPASPVQPCRLSVSLLLLRRSSACPGLGLRRPRAWPLCGRCWHWFPDLCSSAVRVALIRPSSLRCLRRGCGCFGLRCSVPGGVRSQRGRWRVCVPWLPPVGCGCRFRRWRARRVWCRRGRRLRAFPASGRGRGRLWRWRRGWGCRAWCSCRRVCRCRPGGAFARSAVGGSGCPVPVSWGCFSPLSPCVLCG